MTSLNNPPSSRWMRSHLLSWYDIHGRKDLPWKTPITPYRVWVSEIMLQQTQVTTVIEYFQRFIKKFPTVQSLASAPLDDVLAQWAGLGYYARARNLHRAAQIISFELNAQFPKSLEGLLALPGIGQSTAGAILSQAFNQKAAILDGNVKRVLVRLLGITDSLDNKVTLENLWYWANHYTPTKRVNDYTQAIMDLGAIVCKRRNPECYQCPLQLKCLAYIQDIQNELPVPKKRANRKIKKASFLGVIYKNKILLEKRPPQGIWGGLYSFLEFSNCQNLKKWCKEHLPKPYSMQKFETKRHTFTHFHLDFKTHFLKLKDMPAFDSDSTLEWISLKSISQLGLPAPIKKIVLESV